MLRMEQIAWLSKLIRLLDSLKTNATLVIPIRILKCTPQHTYTSFAEVNSRIILSEIFISSIAWVF